MVTGSELMSLDVKLSTELRGCWLLVIALFYFSFDMLYTYSTALTFRASASTHSLSKIALSACSILKASERTLKTEDLIQGRIKAISEFSRPPQKILLKTLQALSPFYKIDLSGGLWKHPKGVWNHSKGLCNGSRGPLNHSCWPLPHSHDTSFGALENILDGLYHTLTASFGLLKTLLMTSTTSYDLFRGPWKHSWWPLPHFHGLC